jgi:hypothetical protein
MRICFITGTHPFMKEGLTMSIHLKNKINNFLCRAVFLLSGILIFNGANICRADGVDPAKEKTFGVTTYYKSLEETVNVQDGFSFTRYENSITKKIDNSDAVTFSYTVEYKTIDFAKMKENIISSRKYTGIIPAGKNNMLVDLKSLMSDLGVKDYSGVIGVKITDSKGADAVLIGQAIDLRLVKIAIDAAAEAAETADE